MTTRPRDGEQGQAMVEFAIVLPLLLLVIVGLIEFGITFNSWLSLNHLSNEGARWAAVGRVPGNESPTGNEIKDYIKSQITTGGLKIGRRGSERLRQALHPEHHASRRRPGHGRDRRQPVLDLQVDGVPPDGRQPEWVVDHAAGEGSSGDPGSDDIGLDGLLRLRMPTSTAACS